jgi:hypothetical protein
MVENENKAFDPNFDAPVAAPPADFDPNDPLSQSVDGIDTSFPLLPAGLYDFEIVDASVAAAKSNPNGQTMTIKLALTENATDTKGEMLNKGFPIYMRIGLTPTEKYAAKDIAKKLADVLKKCGYATGVTPRQFISTPRMIVGKIVRAKVAIRKETDEFPESNEVKSLVDIT